MQLNKEIFIRTAGYKNAEKPRVFITEDEFIVAKNLENKLKSLGCEVVGKSNRGEDALDMIKELKPDLVLMDIKLAGEMSGIQTAKIISDEMEIPIIFLTAYSNMEMFELATSTKPYGYLTKPYEEKNLEITISMTLYRHKKELELKEKKKELEDRNLQLNNMVTEKDNTIKEQLKESEVAQKEIEKQLMMIQDFSETQEHLVAATWREREMKKELQETLNELKKSKEIIEVQNKKITDSINYARRIQRAIIPGIDEIKKDFSETFMLYEPKDVVSGDFPFYHKTESHCYYAAIDCTGHGVPGAMMSLIGYLLLMDILNDQPYLSPANVLLKLHHAVVNTLKQDAPGNKAADGMDIALCCIDNEKNKLEYSGAHRPLYHIRNGELTQYKGDKYPIGGNQYGGKNQFTDHTIDIEEGDAVFFFSDGLPDQFGGPEKLKYGPRRIREGILNNIDKSMEEIKQYFEESFMGWKDDTKQIDDVLLIGVKF